MNTTLSARARAAAAATTLALLLPFAVTAALTVPRPAPPTAPSAVREQAPKAFLRFKPGPPRSYYVEVYMMTPLDGGDLSKVRASLRDRGQPKKLISTDVQPSSVTMPTGVVTNFIIPAPLPETEILQNFANYEVFVDAYPSAGVNKDPEIKVAMDVDVFVDVNPGNRNGACPRRVSLTAVQVSDTPEGAARFHAVNNFLSSPNVAQTLTANVTDENGATKPRTVKPLPTPTHSDPAAPKDLTVCLDFSPPPPPGKYKLSLTFNPPAEPELMRAGLEKGGLFGPNVPDASAEKRDSKDFLDLGLSLTSSVADEEQPDKTTKRVRTTRGIADLFFAPLLNYRTVGAVGDKGGWVQVITPFFIDAKVSTGKITKDTLALNRVNLGLDYEFRHYLNTRAYPNLLRHAFNFKHTSDRDFKQDEAKLVYEFQSIFGALNRPLGSALNILGDEVVPDEGDKFGLEIVPTVGVELGRTYRVRDPKEFEGVSRNVRRFYFGGTMNFELTQYVRLSVNDLFYVRGETPNDRFKNYFMGSVEAPLGRLGKSERFRSAHSLFFSFERGEQPPFSDPAVNILKFGYRIRARGLFNR